MERQPDEFDRFCTLVLSDAALQHELRAPDDADRFVALVVEIARRRGFSLDPEVLWARMRARLPGLEPWVETDIAETPLPPPGWLPIAASWRGDQFYLDWRHFGEQRLIDPFFESSVRRCLYRPFNRLFRHATPISRLPEWLAAHPHLRPSGLIFHMSRCGSTLVSQMLAALSANIVVSEAPPIDAVVQGYRLMPNAGEAQYADWLAASIGVLGHRRSGDERHYFIKLDSWHTLALPLFRRAFPEVPWVFLYRDPVEVMVSQLQMPGMQMLPGGIGPQLYGIERSYGAEMAEDYYAQILAKVCEPVVRHISDGGLLVNYRQLPEAVWTAMLPHFGVACSAGERAMMAAAARYDAKTPGIEFAADSAAKQEGASAATRHAADRWLGDLYRRLETLRAGS
jgi:hypothetical protein